MPQSYNGKILHVDLTDQRVWTEEPDEVIYRKYLGGGALATHFLLRDLQPGIDPLGPENLLIFMTSVINGLPLSGANRYSAAGKSPLTGGFGEAEAGGFWDPNSNAPVLTALSSTGAPHSRSIFISTTVNVTYAMPANTGVNWPAKCRMAWSKNWATSASACSRPVWAAKTKFSMQPSSTSSATFMGAPG